MHSGSCLCGAVRFEIDVQPEVFGSCHCSMCRKFHGAAFASYVSVRTTHFRYIAGEQLLSDYNSSSTIHRKFCSKCGSSMEWGGHPEFQDWVAVSLACFDSDIQPQAFEQYHAEDQVNWLHKALGE